MRGWSGGVVALAVAVTLSACGSNAAVPTVPGDALPGHAASVVELDASLVASDAVHPQELETVLGDAGFVGGRERTFSDPGPPPHRVQARVMQFGDVEGATAYLTWLRGHSSELIGHVKPQSAPELLDAFLVQTVPNACCPKNVPIFLTAWRSGAAVLSLEVAGAAVTRQDVLDLAPAFDHAMGGAR
ncbi:MAG: hypothetical protein ABI879_05715 [Actinomycetota bacterium]